MPLLAVESRTAVPALLPVGPAAGLPRTVVPATTRPEGQAPRLVCVCPHSSHGTPPHVALHSVVPSSWLPIPISYKESILPCKLVHPAGVANQPLLGCGIDVRLVCLAALGQVKPEVGIEQWGVQYLIARLLQSRCIDADLDAESTQVFRFPGLQELGDGTDGDCLALVPTHRPREVGFEATIEQHDGMHNEGIDLDSVLFAFIRDVYADRAVSRGGRVEHGKDGEQFGLGGRAPKPDSVRLVGHAYIPLIGVRGRMIDLGRLLHVGQVRPRHFLPKCLEPPDRVLCFLQAADKDDDWNHGIAIGGRCWKSEGRMVRLDLSASKNGSLTDGWTQI